jgi:polyisoprenoid-binding protein YceI
MESMEKTTWTIDAAHTQIQFKIKHLMISTVTGTLNKFEGTVEAEGNDFSTSKVELTADAASISTSNEQRDVHLKSGDFFDTEKFPKIRFKSTSVKKKDDEYFELSGDLTIRDVTKPVTLQVEFAGLMKDPWGNMKAGFNAKGKINRKDWGLSWNAALETGGVLVSDEVKIECEVQLAQNK